MVRRPDLTLRLHLPQWQGGNLPDYAFGASLLTWLRPASSLWGLVTAAVQSMAPWCDITAIWVESVVRKLMCTRQLGRPRAPRITGARRRGAPGETLVG